MKKVLAEYEDWLKNSKDGKEWAKEQLRKNGGVVRVFAGRDGSVFSMLREDCKGILRPVL